MSSTQFNKGPSYGLSAEVKNRLLSKYDPQKEAKLRSWIEGLTGLSIGPDFQKGLKDGVILCTLMNKLQPGSVPKINHSMQNWHQLENLSNFIKAMVSYGMNPVDLFEANDLFESGNMTQVQVSLLALAGKAKTKGLQSGVNIGVKYSEKQERNFDDATMKAGQCVIGLQMGTNKCASQSGMTAYGTRRHLYDPKNHILPPMDHCTISLQMGTKKCASQVGMTAPGTRRHIYDTKLGTDKCDNSSMSLQMGYTQGANLAARSSDWGGRYMTPSIAHRAQQLTGLRPGVTAKMWPLSTWPTARRKPATEHPRAPAPCIASSSLCGFWGFHCVVLCFETGHLFVSLSGLELTAIFLPQLPEGWDDRSVLSMLLPHPSCLASFPGLTHPAGNKGVLSGIVRLCISQWAVGEAGPKELPVSSSLSCQFVVCEPVEIAGSFNERKQGALCFVCPKIIGVHWALISCRHSEGLSLLSQDPQTSPSFVPSTCSPPSSLWCLKVSVFPASLCRPDQLC